MRQTKTRKNETPQPLHLVGVSVSWRLIGCVLLSFAAMAPGLAADTTFVEALRLRGLDRLAEARCREELSRPNRAPRESATFAIQLSLIEVDRATAARSSAATHWNKAEEQLRTPIADRGSSDAWLLLRLQSGLNRSTRGRFEQVTGDASAAGTLLAARGKLEESQQEIEKLRRAGSDLFTQRELDSLVGRVTLALAETGRWLALSHPAGSPDRDDALLQSAAAARGLAAQSLPGDLRWRALLVLMACERLLGKSASALDRLNGLNTTGAPGDLTGAIAAERWRLLQATGRGDEARRWLDSQTNLDSPELALVRIQTLAQRWKASAESEQTALSAEVQRRLIAGRRRHGGLWAARAERAAGEMLAVTSGDSVDAVVTTAGYLFRAGRKEEAVEAYDRAAGIAYRDGASGRAFELARTSATLVRSLGDRLAASERFRRAAFANPQRADAAATHRLAIVCLAEALRQEGAEKTDAVEAYEPLLTEHLRAWPESPATDEVRWWLIKWKSSRGDWREAIASLEAVNADDPRYPEAIRLLGRAYRGLVAEAADDPVAQQKLVARATSQLQPAITGADNRWPRNWSNLQRETALTLANLNDGAYARRLLEAAIDGQPAVDDEWRRQALPMLMSTLVEEGLTDEALRRVQNPPITDRSTAEAVLDALLKILHDGEDPQSPAATVMLGVVTSATAEGNQDSRWKAPYAAAALATLGRTDDAIKVYRQLVERFPRDAALRLKLAELLSRSGSVTDREQALAGFGIVERGVTNGGDVWWDARIGRLRMLIATGKAEQARKLLRLTRVLHPGPGSRTERLQAVEESLPRGGDS